MYSLIAQKNRCINAGIGRLRILEADHDIDFQVGAFDSQHTLSKYLSIQTMCLSRSVRPLEAIEDSSDSDNLEGHEISGRHLAGR